jgi:hypothetical protein
MLRAATGGSIGQVHAALHHLRKFRAVDVVVENDGRGWWYALPKENDLRERIYEERIPEDKPRKQRKTKRVKP